MIVINDWEYILRGQTVEIKTYVWATTMPGTKLMLKLDGLVYGVHYYFYTKVVCFSLT